MGIHLFILLFAGVIGTVCPTAVGVTKDAAGFELELVHTICRHGDRNSYEPYPNDQWKSKKFWPEGYAQLTKVGIQQHYALGKYLRARYEKLLGNGDYSVDKVFVHSTDTDRTLMSAQACLASLFAPKGNQIWGNLDWQPVPVHTEPRDQDYLLAPEKPCDHYEYEMIKYTNSCEYKSLFTQNEALIADLENKTGASLNTLTKLDFLYDTFFIEKLKKMRIPQWAELAMKDQNFVHLALFYYVIFTKSTEMKKLRSGYLLKEILDRSKNKTMSTLSPDRSLWLYFAHDNTIVDMLNSLGLYKELHVPPYASCLFFELYKANDSTENYLQLFYRKSNTTDVPALEIPNCGLKCPLDKWNELYGDILPTKSYDEECKLRNGETIQPNQNPEHFYL